MMDLICEIFGDEKTDKILNDFFSFFLDVFFRSLGKFFIFQKGVSWRLSYIDIEETVNDIFNGKKEMSRNNFLDSLKKN